MRDQGRTGWIIERVASRQHGLITHEQMVAMGVSSSAIGRRVQSGLLFAEHRGVYRVGHRAPSLEARYMGAVLACGEDALLCRRAAAHLVGLLKGSAPRPEVVAPRERRIPGVLTHRTRCFDPRDGAHFRRIPITRVPCILVDLAPDLSLEALARLCHEAGMRFGTTPAHVKAVLARRPRAPGTANLVQVMVGDVKVVLSELEREFLRRLREAGLPLPQTNRPAGGRRVDCRWPDFKLTVELDSYRFHHTRHAWEQDRRREREARARGDEFRRYTWADVFEDPTYMLAELRALLASLLRAG
jgi:Transcriptional regulator, AbiEi antitoxin